MIEQLQKNQLPLTEGLDKNRLAITQGFDKMDDVKKWDLLQLPGYEANEYDDDDDDDDDGESYMIDPKDIETKVKTKRKDYFKILGSKYVPGDPEEIINTDLRNIAYKLKDFNYKCDKDKNMIKLIEEKPE